MSKKSPSKAYRCCGCCEANTKEVRNETLDEVKKIIDKKLNLLNAKIQRRTLNSNQYKSSACQLTVVKQLKEEIKKIHSPESMTDGTFDASKDTNTQNIHTGGAQSTGGLTGGEVKSEETYNGVNSQKPVICKPELLCPPANNQNLKGCGKYIEDMDGVCGIDGLCEKCQGKVR